MPQDIVSDIQALLEGKAEGRYGLTFINQQQHALQAAWLAEQVPGSLADFKKGLQQPAAEPTAPTIQIPGPAPAIITSPEIKVK